MFGSPHFQISFFQDGPTALGKVNSGSYANDCSSQYKSYQVDNICDITGSSNGWDVSAFEVSRVLQLEVDPGLKLLFRNATYVNTIQIKPVYYFPFSCLIRAPY